MKINVVGGGLAGVEAAYYLLKKGYKVDMYEMRPIKMTGAHRTSNLAELVCSNSLRSNDLNNAIGLMKEELRILDSLIMNAAEYAKIPAGSALAVDREKFSNYIKTKLENFSNFRLYHKEIQSLNTNEYNIVATGPLTSDKLMNDLKKIIQKNFLHFYDAVSPIISSDSIDMNICYKKSRYDKGEGDYINCPMTKDEYENFYDLIINSEKTKEKDFERKVFEGCMPIEDMAKRGKETMLFGPLKPVGLEYNNIRPYAVIQLRQDDAASSMYNIVGFQTKLKFPDQKKIIRTIPGLKKAEILRYGVMHKNNYIESPKILINGYRLKNYPKIFIAGQLSGVEGYVESAGSGLCSAINLDNFISKKSYLTLPEETMLGAMSKYVSTENKSFVPMNANFGLFSQLSKKMKKKERRIYFSTRALKKIKEFKKKNII